MSNAIGDASIKQTQSASSTQRRIRNIGSPPKGARESSATHKRSDTSRPLLGSVPERKVVDHPGEDASLGSTEEETESGDTGRVGRASDPHAESAEGHHKKRQPPVGPSTLVSKTLRMCTGRNEDNTYTRGEKIFKAMLLGASKMQYATRNSMRAMVKSLGLMWLVDMMSSCVSALRILALPKAHRMMSCL